MYNRHSINNFIWENLLLSELNLNGENITIKIIKDDNSIKQINCEEFIGIKCLGKWEEGVIDSITVEKTGDVIVESVSKIKQNYDLPVSIHNARNVFYPWIQVNIRLVDGCFVKIACKNTYIID